MKNIVFLEVKMKELALYQKEHISKSEAENGN